MLRRGIRPALHLVEHKIGVFAAMKPKSHRMD